MRDLKRRNAKEPAYKQLQESGVKVFVPMKWQLVIRKGKKVREEVPFIQDLLFVCDSRQHLDPIVEKTRTLQYRWLRNTYREPMTVSDSEMENSCLQSASQNPPGIICRKRLLRKCTDVKSKLLVVRSTAMKGL